MSAGEQQPDVGTLHEEVARLLGALGGMAQPGQPHDPTAELGADCQYCPVCRVIHVVRQTSPEVRDHLATAATSLLAVATELLASHVPPRPETDVTGETHVQRIDLDAED